MGDSLFMMAGDDSGSTHHSAGRVAKNRLVGSNWMLMVLMVHPCHQAHGKIDRKSWCSSLMLWVTIFPMDYSWMVAVWPKRCCWEIQYWFISVH